MPRRHAARERRRIVADLGLAYRVLDLCTGDLGFSSARTFDIEVYAPGSTAGSRCRRCPGSATTRPGEATSGSDRAGAKGTEVVHTLNGSALAWPRIVAALLETHRQPDGSVAIPDVLRPYMGGRTAITARPNT